MGAHAITNVDPYKSGDRIKVYIHDAPQPDLAEKTLTFGRVVSVDESGKPLLTYEDLSDIPLHKFNRFVMRAEVLFKDKYIVFCNDNGVIKKHI